MWCAGLQVQGRWGTKLDIQLGYHPLGIVQHKASTCKATLDILLCYQGKEGLAEEAEELELAYIADVHAHQAFNLATVRLL